MPGFTRPLFLNFCYTKAGRGLFTALAERLFSITMICRYVLRICVLLFGFSLTQEVPATIYWDVNGSTTGAGGPAPSGMWSGPNWSSSANGDVATQTSDGSKAIFSAGSDATGAFDVTVTGSQSAAGLQFEEGTVSILGNFDTSLWITESTVEVAAGSAAIMKGLLYSSVGLTKTGLGTLVFDGNQHLTGTTQINAGVLELIGGSLGPTVFVADAATLQFTKDGGSTGVVAPIALRGSGTMGTNGAMRKLGAGSVGLHGGVTLEDDTLVAVEAGSLSIYGPGISGSGGLTKTGTGSLSIQAAGTYSGLTTVSSGRLSITDGAALGSTSQGTIVEPGAALSFSNGAGHVSVTEPVTIRGTGLSNTGALRSAMGSSYTAAMSGSITLGAGGARINSDGGTFNVSGSIHGPGENLTLGGISSRTMTISGTIGTAAQPLGSLTKDGSMTVALNAAGGNYYAGPTTISAGTLLVNNSSGSATGSGNVTVTGGRADYT